MSTDEMINKINENINNGVIVKPYSYEIKQYIIELVENNCVNIVDYFGDGTLFIKKDN